MSAIHTSAPNKSGTIGYIVLNASKRRAGPLAGMADALERFYNVREVVFETGAIADAVDGVDAAARDLKRTCSSVVLVAAGHEARGALDAAGCLPSAIDTLVLADPMLEEAKPAQALFSGFAALSMVGLALAGLVRQNTATRGLEAISQPVLVMATSTGTGARNRSVQRLQSGITGLVELACVEAADGVGEAVDRLVAFADRMCLRSLKVRRIGDQKKPAAVAALQSAIAAA